MLAVIHEAATLPARASSSPPKTHAREPSDFSHGLAGRHARKETFFSNKHLTLCMTILSAITTRILRFHETDRPSFIMLVDGAAFVGVVGLIVGAAFLKDILY